MSLTFGSISVSSGYYLLFGSAVELLHSVFAMVISSASSGQHAFLLTDCDNVFRMSPRGIEYALCTICDENISLARTGIKALTKHCKSDRHIRLKGSRESACTCRWKVLCECI